MNINSGSTMQMTGNMVYMGDRHRTNLVAPEEKTMNAWTACSLYNWSGGGRDAHHSVIENQVFRVADTTQAFINQTNPQDPVIERNQWESDIDWNHEILQRFPSR